MQYYESSPLPFYYKINLCAPRKTFLEYNAVAILFIEGKNRLNQGESEQGGINLSISDIKDKIEVAERVKEKNIQDKLSEREAFISEAKIIDELVKEARSNVEYWDSMRELGELKEQDVEKLKDMKNMLVSLEDKFQEIERRIEIISSRPVINEKLKEAALEEDEDRNRKTVFEKNEREIEQKTKDLAEDIKELAPKREETLLSWRNQEKLYFSLKNKIYEIIENVKNTYLEKRVNKEDFLKELEQKFFYETPGGVETYKEYLARLQKLREGLGFLKGKEKATIDYLINHRLDFENIQEANDGLIKKEKERDVILSEIKKLHLKYNEIVQKSDEMREMAKNANIDWRLYSPNFELNRLIRDYADIKRYRGNQEVGTYKGWHDATSNSETARRLYDTYQDVVGGEV